MKHILLLSAIILILSCKNKPSRPTADIPKGTVDSMVLTNNDTIYDLKKSPGQRHEFKVIARCDTMVVENRSK